MEIFLFCVITFEPILSKTPQNDRQSLSFVKDGHTYGEKVARNGRTKVIYKGTFIFNQSLEASNHTFASDFKHPNLKGSVKLPKNLILNDIQSQCVFSEDMIY